MPTFISSHCFSWDALGTNEPNRKKKSIQQKCSSKTVKEQKIDSDTTFSYATCAFIYCFHLFLLQTYYNIFFNSEGRCIYFYMGFGPMSRSYIFCLALKCNNVEKSILQNDLGFSHTNLCWSWVNWCQSWQKYRVLPISGPPRGRGGAFGTRGLIFSWLLHF